MFFNDPFYYDTMQQFAKYQQAFFRLYDAAEDVIDEAKRCLKAGENPGPDFGENLLHLNNILTEVYEFYNVKDKQWRDGLIKKQEKDRTDTEKD